MILVCDKKRLNKPCLEKIKRHNTTIEATGMTIGKRKEVLKKSLPKTVLRINKAITKDKPINTGIQTPIKRSVLAAANWKAVFLKTDL